MAAAIRVAALVAVALALVNVRGEPDTPVTFLLDVGRPTGTRPPMAVIAGRAHPVLFAPSTTGAGEARTIVPAELAVDVPLEASVVTPRENLALEALVLLGDENRRVVPEWRDGAAPSVRLGFSPDEVGKRVHAMVIATRLPPPGRRVITLGPAIVQPDTLLVLAYGIEASHCAGHPPVDLGVDIVEGGRARPLLRQRLDPETACDAWIGARVALDAYVGRSVRFRFRVRAVHAADRDERLFLLWADPRLVAPRRGRPAPPNIVLVSLDTLGARHLSTYDYPYPTSPEFTKLARRGTLFERAISHYPSTTASHMTLFTGRFPIAHDVRSFFSSLAPDVPTLPVLLRRAGYMTAASTEDANVLRTMGFERGFHVYWESHAAPGAPGIQRAVRWLRWRPPEPFFLFVHTYEVHSPYTPRPQDLALVRPRETVRSDDYAARHDGEIRYLDWIVGNLLEQLNGQGLLGRTIVVITSDHGEAFGEHGSYGHSVMLYDEVMHVPLLFLGPQVPEGLRVTDRAGLVDLVPTLLELAGVPAPAGLNGRSLVPTLRGRPLAPRPQVAEVRGSLGDPSAPEPNLRAVWLDDRKVIRDLAHDRWEVFDLRKDPGETTNLAESEPTAIDAARAVLAHYDRLGESHAGLPVVSPEAVDRFRALGYVE